MNILVLDQFSEPGGAQQELLDLLPGIGARGWSALIGMPGEGAMFEHVRALGFDAERIECGPYRSGEKSLSDLMRFACGTPRLARQMRGLADRVKADVVYLNGPRLLPAAALAALACPVLFHSHSYLPPGVMRNAAGFALRQLNAQVVAACEYVAGPWKRFVAEDRIAVVYNGVAGPAGSPERRLEGPPRIGCIGRIAPEKGQREFVAAAAEIHASMPDCRFTIFGAPLFADAAGERYASEVRAAAEGLPIEFAGWVNDVYSAMADLDLLLVPSTGPEATTRVILEAFAAGLPVVAIETGGIGEVVENGVTGLLAHSPEEMARLAMVLLNGDPRRLISITRAARASWQTRFTREHFQDQMMRVIEGVSQLDCGA